MACKECGCMIPYYAKNVDKIEDYQNKINELYKKSPIQRDEIRRLKIKRDKLLGEIMFMLEEKEYWTRIELFKYRGTPIEWWNGKRQEGVEYDEATDWEYDEVSSDED